MPSLSSSRRIQVFERARKRCEYCQTQADIVIYLTIDHIKPLSDGGDDSLDNLCAACANCNAHKHNYKTGIDPEAGTETEVPLFNPRLQVWSEHFAWDETQTLIVGLTAIGRTTVARLSMNHEDRVAARKMWVSVGWHPPKD